MEIKDILDRIDCEHRQIQRKAKKTDEDAERLAGILEVNDLCLRVQAAGFVDTDELEPLMIQDEEE